LKNQNKETKKQENELNEFKNSMHKLIKDDIELINKVF